MASFNFTSGFHNGYQVLYAGETGAVSASATLSTSGGFAVQITGLHAGSLANPTVRNAGTITSFFSTISLDGVQGSVYILNSGTISGDLGAITMSSSNNLVVDNAGSIIGSSSGFGAIAFGGGDDLVVVRNDSSITGEVDGGSGIDTLYYGLWSGSGINVALDGLGTGMDTNRRFENVYGSDRADSITGNASANVLVGLDGNDVLDGSLGNDTLWGAFGRDTLIGGEGDDTLYGGADNDSMAGGAGSDVYQVTGAGDIVTENPAEGTDYVFTTVSWTVTSGNLEGVYAVGDGITLTGSAFADILVADAAGSPLNGGIGDDTLYGGIGVDTLVGGIGQDVLRGGAGNDFLTGGAGNDQLVGGGGADRFIFNAPSWGYDQIFDFVAGTDRLDMRGSGAASIDALTIYTIGSNTVVMFGDARIDLYGVIDLGASDFIFPA